MEEMQNGRVVIRRYLNRQIGNILKELKLTEGNVQEYQPYSNQ
jgi:hypothetical protein